MKVKFYNEIDEDLLKFAVIISKYDGKLVFCRHKERNTYEIPGGHREKGETIEETAVRELREETGAIEFEMEPICIYSVTGKNRVNSEGSETFGKLFFAKIKSFEHKINSEIERIDFFEKLPSELTYPDIQPVLIEEFLRRKNGIQTYQKQKKNCGTFNR